LKLAPSAIVGLVLRSLCSAAYIRRQTLPHLSLVMRAMGRAGFEVADYQVLARKAGSAVNPIPLKRQYVYER